jgi:endonuclease YncB( thermonuclease family)
LKRDNNGAHGHCGYARACGTRGRTDITGAVTRVHDEDTFSMGKQRIRVYGIDALELNQQCRADRSTSQVRALATCRRQLFQADYGKNGSLHRPRRGPLALVCTC